MPPLTRPTKFRKLGLVLAIQVLWLLACAGVDLPLSLTQATPTQAALVVNFEVTVIRPTETFSPTPLPQPSPSPTPPAPAATATLTPSPTLVLTPIGAPAPPADNAPSVETVTATAVITPTLGWQESGINLLEPPDAFVFPADVGPAEFKWAWGQGCQPPPEGQGFEVRIWPESPEFGPMGAMDAAANQADVACDEKSGVRSYRVGQLRQAPGLSATGSGRFRWDVALVQLEPYTALAVSGSRVFDLLPAPGATPAPEAAALLPAELDLAGAISLVEPQHMTTLPSTEKVEFKWQWSNDQSCLPPPAGYGFELRIWPNRPNFGPMGAMGDAAQGQADVFCDSGNGLRGYLVKDLLQAPGVSVAGAGDFVWDVAFVKLDPYTKITTSEPRIFTIPGVSKLDG